MKEFYAPSGIIDALEDGGDYAFRSKKPSPITVNCKICGAGITLTTKTVTCSICSVCAGKLKRLIDLLPQIEAALEEHPIGK